MNEQGQETALGGRQVTVDAYGDSANEIELYALDRAREFFGGDLQLEVVRDYRAYASEVGKGRYWAVVAVRAVEPS